MTTPNHLMKLTHLDQVTDWLYLSVGNLALAFPDESRHSLRVRLHAWEKSGHLLSVMRNVYLDPNSVWFKKDPQTYLKVLACTIKTPSYVSLESVLSLYQVFTEARYGLTLVTTKSRSLHTTPFETITYKQISERLLGGYEVVQYGPWQYFQATKAKALFDWLYYRQYSLSANLIDFNPVEEWRLNLHSFTKQDWAEIHSWITRSRYKNRLTLIVERLSICTPS